MEGLLSMGPTPSSFLHISQKDSFEVSDIHTLKFNLKQQENYFKAQTKAHTEIVNDLTNKVQTAEHKLKDMTDRVEAIEEEYSARLEEHENALNKLANFPQVDHFKKLEDKIKVLKEQSNNIVDKLSDMTSQIITNEYANDEFMDTQVEEIKKEIAMFVNNKISQEEGQREACSSDNIFNFVATDATFR